MKIAILTLTGQRDKIIDCMLADELRKHGHEVNVRCYIYAGRETVCYEKPDVVIHPMPGGQYKYDFLKQCKDWGIVNIIRRGEAGMGKREFEGLSDDRKDIILGNWDYGPYIDLELVWGQEFAEIIQEQGHADFDKLRVCGAFAFDPYFAKQPLKVPREKTILFATGFSTCDCHSDYCETGLPEDSDYHKEIYATHRKARDLWIDAINYLVKGHDDWKFELKVRPGEMTVEYREKLPDCVKIYLQATSASEVLREVDILVHSGSTMAIEAHLLGLSSFNFCNVNPDPLLSKVSPVAGDVKELEWLISQVIPGMVNIDTKIFEELKYHLYGEIDGQACERASSHINNYLTDLNTVTEIPNTWPKTTLYHKDKENIKLAQTKGCVNWLCPCCRNTYYVKREVNRAKCPYCSMGIVKMVEKMEAMAK